MTNPSNPKPVPGQSVHDVYVSLLVEFIGVAILAVVADMNDNLGKIAVTLMAGWVLIYFITHDTFLQGIVGRVGG